MAEFESLRRFSVDDRAGLDQTRRVGVDPVGTLSPADDCNASWRQVAACDDLLRGRRAHDVWLSEENRGGGSVGDLPENYMRELEKFLSAAHAR